MGIKVFLKIVFAGLLVLLLAGFLLPPREQVLTGPVQSEQGYAWVAPLSGHAWFSDSLSDPRASPLRLYEDGKLLAQSHCLHDTIRNRGGGCYSHWGGTLYFSTSDNSDPNVNGRTYRVVYAYGDLLKGPELVYWAVIALLAGIVAGPLIVAWRRRVPWVGGMAFIGGGLIWVFALNGINVFSLGGSALYGLLFAVLLIQVLLTAFAAFRANLPGGIVRFAVVWQVLAVVILSGEALARALPVYDSLAVNPGVKYFWPDWVYYPLNNFGHRDRDFSTEKTTDTFRILMLGDSFTEGAGLSREETFSRRLEYHLNSRLKNTARQIESYNMGHSGSNTREQVDLLLKQGDDLKPDLVIVNYFVNDAETHPLTYSYFNAPPWVLAYRRVFLRKLGSYAYYRAQKTITLFPGSYASRADYFAIQHSPDGPGWKAVQDAARDLRDFLDSHSITGIVTLWPLQTEGPYELTEIHDQVAKTMRENGLVVWDLFPVLKSDTLELKRWTLSSYDLHPNAAANDLVARFYAERILTLPAFQRWQETP